MLPTSDYDGGGGGDNIGDIKSNGSLPVTFLRSPTTCWLLAEDLFGLLVLVFPNLQVHNTSYYTITQAKTISCVFFSHGGDDDVVDVDDDDYDDDI